MTPKKNFVGVLNNYSTFGVKNVCLYPNRQNEVFYGYFWTFMAIWDTFVRMGRDTRSGHICHYLYVFGRGTKKPKTGRNTAIFRMFWKFQLYFYIKLINLGSFLKSDNFWTRANFLWGLKKFGLLLEWKCLFASKGPKKSHLEQLLYIKGSLRLIRMYWAEKQKVDIFATIRTYWAEVLKDPQLADI